MTSSLDTYILETRTCTWCGEAGTVELDADSYIGYAKWSLRQLTIQDAMPNIPMDIREQIMTGYHPECWTAMFGKSDE
jgi:hypothetical protein